MKTNRIARAGAIRDISIKRSRDVDLSLKLSKILVYLLLFTIFVQEARLTPAGLAFPEISSSATLERAGWPFVSEVIVIGIIVTFFTGVATGRVPLLMERHHKLLFWMSYLAILIIPLSKLFGMEQSGAEFGAIRMILEGLILCFVVSSLPWRTKELCRLQVLVIVAGLFHSAVVVTSFLSPESLPFETNVIPLIDSNRYAGLFLQPSRVALLLAIALAIATTRILVERPGWSSIAVYVGTVILLVWGMLLSQTATVFVAVPIAIFAALAQLAFRGPHTQRRSLLGFVPLVVGSLVLLLLLSDVVKLGISRFDQETVLSLSGRNEIWPIAVGILARYPLGTGYAAFPSLSGSMEIPHAHNMYLQWGVMFGWIGLALLMWFIGHIYRRSGQYTEQLSGQGKHTAILVAFRAAWFVSLLAFLSEPYLVTNIGYLFWLVSGLLLAEWLPSERDKEELIGA